LINHEKISTVTSRDEFNKILLEAIDEGIKRILGEPAAQSIYFYLERDEHLRREDIPNNLEKFLFTLERIFSVGALVIEKAIMENLYLRLRRRNKNLLLKYKDTEQFNFISYINDLKGSNEFWLKRTCV
jgi:hypothetical protein